MPLLTLARLLLGLISLIILGSAVYLLWSWCDGAWIADPQGDLHRVRETWRLWTGLGLLAWSLGGRWLVTPLLARRDTDPTRPERSPGELVESPTGSWLHVETEGAAGAPTVILTHGWGLDSTIWFYLRRALSDRFQVVAWDLPGLGRSRAAPHAIDLRKFALDLATVLERYPGPAVLVGHSIGGMTIQTLLRDHPELVRDRVRGVVLINTTFTNPLRTMIFSRLALALRWPVLEPAMRLTIWLKPLAWLSAWQSYLSGTAHVANRLGFSSDVTRSQLEHTTLLATRNSPANQARGNLAMFRWTSDGAVAHADPPSLVIAGADDIMTKPEASEVLASAPLARLERVDKANHMGFLEQASVYNAMIGDFCSRVATPASTSETRRRDK
jgi:pimeloyl-ACP methyl ester carboxylesterase